MVESRDIERFDTPIQYKGYSFNLRLTVVRLWDQKRSDHCSRFNLQLKVFNDSVENYIEEERLEGGKWTVLAHSDHNPYGGHNVHDPDDIKQLHVDVHPSINNGGYNRCYDKICDGNPPESNDEAIEIVREYMMKNSERILSDYMAYFQ